MDGKLNAAFLRQLEEDAIALLGEHYTKLLAQRTRGLDSRHPPTNPHRLVDAIRRVAASRHNLEARIGLVDAEAIVEVRTLLVLAERWRNDAIWSELQNSLRDPNQYVHTLLLLSAHHVWSGAGNVVSLKRADGTSRTFDLDMHDLGYSVGVEVKVPLKLRRGGKPPLKALAAKEVVLDALKKAGTRTGGQLPPDRCGILVIGGLSLKQLDLDRLAQGAEALFAARTLSHIGAIQILSIGIHVTNPGPIGAEGVSMVPGSSLQTRFGIRIVRNRRYLGLVRLTPVLPTPADQLLMASSREIDLPDQLSLRRFR